MPHIPLSDQDQKDLQKRFTYHRPHGDQPARYEELRGKALKLAEDITRACPPGRERALAITNLEQAIFWANAAIARNEAETPEKP
jgi:hypothetical protein